MFWRIVFRALRRPRGKLAAIAVTVALGISLATAMLSVLFDIGDKVNRELRSYGANLTVVPKALALVGSDYGFRQDAAGDAPETAYVPPALKESDLYKIKMVFWAHNIVDFAPLLESRATVAGQVVPIVGTWFDKRLLLPTGDEAHAGLKGVKTWWAVTGDWVSSDDSRDRAMIGAVLAQKLGVVPGDTLVLSSPQGKMSGRVTITGVFEDGGEDDGKIYAPIGLVQDLAGRPDAVDRVEISALTTPENDLARRAAEDPTSLSRSEWDTWYCTAYISSIAYQIEEALPDAQVKTNFRIADSEGVILEKIQFLMVLLTLAAVFCAALAISNLVTACVMETTKELGLLKALGASTGAVVGLVMAEILIAAFAGGILGYGAGLGFGQIIGRSVFGSAIEPHGLVVPLIVLMGVGMVFLGSLPALRQLVVLKPAAVLHGR